MSLGTKPDKFKLPAGESPIEALVYSRVCNLAGLEMGVEEIKTYWASREPQAGRGTRTIWLSKDIERATRLVTMIAPFCHVAEVPGLETHHRPIVVYDSSRIEEAKAFAEESDVDPIFISADHPNAFDGKIIIGTLKSGLNSFVELYVIGSYVQAAASAAGVVAALVSKCPGIAVADLQKILLANASKSMGMPALRRV